jgi:hypothetical protein
MVHGRIESNVTQWPDDIIPKVSRVLDLPLSKLRSRTTARLKLLYTQPMDFFESMNTLKQFTGNSAPPSQT